MLDDLAQLTGDPKTTPAARRTRSAQSLGQQFLASPLFDWLQKSKGGRTGRWASPADAVSELQLVAATLTEAPASGGGLVVPQVVPGIVPSATKPIVMARAVRARTGDERRDHLHERNAVHERGRAGQRGQRRSPNRR